MTSQAITTPAEEAPRSVPAHRGFPAKCETPGLVWSGSNPLSSMISITYLSHARPDISLGIAKARKTSQNQGQRRPGAGAEDHGRALRVKSANESGWRETLRRFRPHWPGFKKNLPIDGRIADADIENSLPIVQILGIQHPRAGSRLAAPATAGRIAGGGRWRPC